MSMFQGVLLPITWTWFWHEETICQLPSKNFKNVFLKPFAKFSISLTMTNTMTDSAVTPQPHVPHTHTSPAIIQLLKNLSLPNVLQRNKKIEAGNDARSTKTLNNALDLAGHPQPGSEVASLITIDPEDLAWLRVPSFFASIHDHIYNSLARRLTDNELKEKEEKKRKDDNIPQEDLRLSKRHCMDGTNHVERVVGEPIPIEFSQSLYDTEVCVAVPLPFFLTWNLWTLVDKASTLPTVKSNPAPGETKGIHILNIDKLSACFEKELSLTCSQWSEAAANMWSFQISRDKSGANGKHAVWFEKHFNFFNMLNKRDKLYNAWKVMELEFLQDHRSRHLKFSAPDYDKALSLTKESHKLQKEFQEFITSSQMVIQQSGPPYHSSAGPPSQRNFPQGPFQPHTFSQPFSSGSSKPSSSTVCLICAQRGHNLFFHQKTTTTIKFADRKAVWAKCSPGTGLITPENQMICINWNVQGANAAPQCTSIHKDDHLHLCSFCGSKSHHALSWTCHTKTAWRLFLHVNPPLSHIHRFFTFCLPSYPLTLIYCPSFLDLSPHSTPLWLWCLRIAFAQTQPNISLPSPSSQPEAQLSHQAHVCIDKWGRSPQ